MASVISALFKAPSTKEDPGPDSFLIKTDDEKYGLSDQLLRELFENSSDMIMISDFDGTINYLSPNLTKLLGYTVDSFKSQDIARSLVHPDDRKTYYTTFYDVRQTPGKSCSMLGRFKHADGNYVWIEGNVTNMLHKAAANGIVSNFRNITERKNAQEKLLQSEERYRKIAETAQEGIWMSDENMVTVFVNQKMCDLLEYTAEELIAKHTYDFKENPGAKDVFERLERRRLGNIENHESVFITKSGKRIVLEVATNGLFDDNGKFLGTLAMLTDITQRKADEDALKRSEANLSAIIENTTDLVYSLDTQYRIITFNKLFKKTMKEVYSFDVDEGVSTLDLIHTLDPETAEKWRQIYAKALKGDTLNFVNEYPFGDGGKVYLSYSVNPIWNGNEVIGLSCFSRDITRQKLDEIAIKKSEASLRTIFNNIDFSCILIDTDGNIVSFNELAQQFTRRNGDIVLAEGVSILDIVRKDRVPFISKVLDEVKKGKRINYQGNYQHNGVDEWYDMTWFGIKNQDNEHLGYIFTNKNITEEKKSEIEREKITNDLLRRNKALEQFTYIISHNLRAPVANLIGLSSLLKSTDTDSEQLEIATGIDTSANKLDEVIKDLNQILQANEQVSEKLQLVVLPDLIANIKESISHLIEKENVNLICDFCEADSLFTLKSFIHSIFYNLILNSIKYRRVGSSPTVSIKTQKNDNNLVILYQDNGRGIDTIKYKHDLFGLYKRFDASVEGKGMGLFMVKMQVESLGGSINIKSELDKGTEFRLEFPIRTDQDHL